MASPARGAQAPGQIRTTVSLSCSWIATSTWNVPREIVLGIDTIRYGGREETAAGNVCEVST